MSPATPDPRLLRLLGGEALASRRQRLRRHFERLPTDAPGSVMRLGALNAVEHEALALLTGRPPRPLKSMQLDIAALGATLREAGIASSLRAALEQLDGPIVHRAAEREARQGQWNATLAAARHPSLIAWLQAPAALGLLKRLARQDSAAGARLLERIERVLQELPAAGMPRAQLAARTLGDAHALDKGQPAATLLLAALQLREGATDSARELWARVGVTVNELARPALCLNLPVRPDAAPACTPGEPAYLSLRRLLRDPPPWDLAGRPVFVCENPNLLAIAADALGPACAPLVCTDGMPAAAQRVLLDQLRAAGAALNYHGDFDWPGLRIGNEMVRRFGARPWRFSAGDYASALQQSTGHPTGLAGEPAAADWDAALAPQMLRHGTALAEEAVAGTLLDDLS